MTYKVQVGPSQIAIHQGQTVLVTEPDGQIKWPSQCGLYFRDTRLISAWAIFANGQPWTLLNGGAISYSAARVFHSNRAFVSEDGPIVEQSLGLTIGRHIDGGLHEDIKITNHCQNPVRFNLEIMIRSDFADIFEVKSDSIVRRGRITTCWSEEQQTLRMTYRNKDFKRELIIRLASGEGEPAVSANGRLSFEIKLKAGQAWRRCLHYDLVDGEKCIPAPRTCIHSSSDSVAAVNQNKWKSTVLKIDTSNEEFYRLYNQGVQDIVSLKLPLESEDHMVFVPAAGLPWFVALFGRDSLIVSLQSTIVYPEFAFGALDILAHYQATELDDYRDAEPGKILHELRYGELAHFKLIPHTPYYGTADATPLYLIALHTAWRATGDRALIERNLRCAEGCLGWIDEYGDRDGDGFQEYETRSVTGYENMAWKDSGDAVMYPDGALVRGPKALCELQGYVYDAWLRMAEIYDELGNEVKADTLRKKAAELYRNFNDKFWDEDAGFYAFALDRDKKKVLSVVSNVGHCLWSGIIAPDRAQRVVKRLMREDMWSGWGIRTLSAEHPSFNPYNYQTGAVWPHDNSLIALGMRRYGFAAEAAAVARDISRAGSYFLQNQLPELYGGLQREATSFPIQYLGANVPQAWAAGAPFMLLQTILGVRQDAPRGKLYVDPALPDWLPAIKLTDIRVGQECFDIRFWRDGKETLFEVMKGKPDVVERSNIMLASSVVHGGDFDCARDHRFSSAVGDVQKDIAQTDTLAYLKKILVLDVGGSHVKALASGQSEHRAFESGPALTPMQLVSNVREMVGDWLFDAISIGYPGPVAHNKPITEPHNLGKGWVGFNFAEGFGSPVKIVNDAALQALGSYRGGKMLFLGLGTGLGSAMIVDGIIEPMELSHLSYKKATYEYYVGNAALERDGKKKWQRHVEEIVEKLIVALEPDDIVIGGGNAKKLGEMPPHCRAGDNANAFTGGFRLWDAHRADSHPEINRPGSNIEGKS